MRKFSELRVGDVYRSVVSIVKLIPAFKALMEEGDENRKMVQTFSIMLQEKLNMNHRQTIPTNEEVKDAILQLKSVPKLLPICTLMLTPIPFGVSGYIAISYVIWKASGEKINILPNKFHDMMLSIDRIRKKIKLPESRPPSK